MLDRGARARLRTLGKNNADLVARHLVMAGRLIDHEPDVAYEHAQAAMRRAGRVDVVREALALTAYATGNYAEALRELRTVRRLSGIDAHRPMEADCERGLGRPERALSIVAETDPKSLSEEDRVELAIVASGARADLGEHEAGLLVLESALVGRITQPELERRVSLVRAERLDELGRADEAQAVRAAAGPEPEEDIVVMDLGDDEDLAADSATAVGPAGNTDESDDAADESDGATDESDGATDESDETGSEGAADLDEPDSDPARTAEEADDAAEADDEPETEPSEQLEPGLGEAAPEERA
ncbi:hypothetical protein [Georgenia subflava]|uniref:Replicase polyprotein 1ab n=1 Tax=Georgenia subflava TaxID=1622177 RepID=A0A6N7EP22_9MICO|nr:hypothetical protein [Georgenia subflava]MPV38863.1 hypothetical protein [Georgenia subflava]